MKTNSNSVSGSARCSEGIFDVLFSNKTSKPLEGKKGNIRFHKTVDGLYGSMERRIAPMENQNVDGKQIEEVTFLFYEEMFSFLEDYPGFQFVRIWNYVPLIVENMDPSAPDVESYRCFNGGRYKAFQDRYGEDMNDWHIPAASAVGALDNTLSINFFASDAPSVFFENKVQIPAYKYSNKYGKLPPVFTRGAICDLEDETLLLISGTASVVNEDTLHADDIRLQIRQTFANIDTLIHPESLTKYGPNYQFDIEDLALLRVYHKHHSDLDLIESEIQKIVSSDCKVTYINTDICRKELVIEIEGIYRKRKS